MSNNRNRYNELFDFYGSLLTERQRDIFTYYYREDYSLAEIAESEGVSRAAVSDALKRCREELLSYEERLHLFASFEKRMQLYEKIKQLTTSQQIHDLLDECIDTEIEGGKQ